MLLICAYEWCAWVVLTRGGGPQKPIGMRLTEVEGKGITRTAITGLQLWLG